MNIKRTKSAQKEREWVGERTHGKKRTTHLAFSKGKQVCSCACDVENTLA